MTSGNCKTNYLLKEYKRVKDNNRSTECNREDFEFLDEMDIIVGDRDCINPTDTLDAADEIIPATPTSNRPNNP